MSLHLNWSHYYELIKFNDISEFNYYVKITEDQNLSVRELRERIKNKEYERLDDKTIGIIIFKKDNRYIMAYCSNEKILSRKYELV